MIDLVIFDCDGVLVDTERLAVKIDVEVLGRLGDERKRGDRALRRPLGATIRGKIEAQAIDVVYGGLRPLRDAA